MSSPTTVDPEVQKEKDKYDFYLKIITAPLAGSIVLFGILAYVVNKYEKTKKYTAVPAILAILCFLGALITAAFFGYKRSTAGGVQDP